MAHQLPARPNLEHLRSQAKALLAALKKGEPAAERTFITHLPAARRLSPAKVRAAGLKLADAQSAIARQAGFESWPLLARHVEQLRLLEGAWQFVGLQVDGADMPVAALAHSRLLLDGDRFRMESPEGNYDGVFTVDVTKDPARIDIEFVEGPEAGNRSFGIYELDGDRLTMCIGVVGASRPAGFISRPGTGHALERLRRATAARPAGVTGGTRQAAAPPASTRAATAAEAATFDGAMTPMLGRLQGEWMPTQLVQNGEEMQASWLAFGLRTISGNETKVVFGGQVMLHAKMRIDEQAAPIAVDYLNLAGGQKGRVSLGILDWIGDEVRLLVAPPGQPRPTDFTAVPKSHTLSRWRRR